MQFCPCVLVSPISGACSQVVVNRYSCKPIYLCTDLVVRRLSCSYVVATKLPIRLAEGIAEKAGFGDSNVAMVLNLAIMPKSMKGNGQSVVKMQFSDGASR